MAGGERPRAAVIGGTGLYDLELDGKRETAVSTPYGDPSGPIVTGELEGAEIAFLARHGRGHRLLPSEVPSRANMHALKQLGVERVISVSAVGSLREEIAPLHVVVPDQLVDRTRLRENTFFGGGVVAHVSFADPFCPALSARLADAAEPDATTHRGGAMVVIEGPAFSTRAESEIHRSWGASVIGMTALPEAKLAREAEMCYATLACVTDYDVWHSVYGTVTAEAVIANLGRNAAAARSILRRLVPALGGERACACADALQGALVTAGADAPREALERLGPIVSRYITTAGAS